MNVAPQLVENLLRRDPLISQALVYGDHRPFPVALVTLNPHEVERLVRDQGIDIADPARLGTHPKVTDRIAQIVEAANSELQSYARVKKFAVPPVELTEEADELTPSQKVKRQIVAEKYHALVESLYV
jgi:long-chain acyl-CoA synthetase